MSKRTFVFVDVGNSRIKLATVSAKSLNEAVAHPENWQHETLLSKSISISKIATSFSAETEWYICSVNPATTEQLETQLKKTDAVVHILQQKDIPISTAPEISLTTGSDRLCAAAAVNKLRTKDHAAIVIDSGTAVTIDVVSAQGVFMGGVIFAGLATSFRSLNRDTSALPEIEISQPLGTEQVIGLNTTEAIQRGVYWSHIGAIESVVARISAQLDVTADLFVTGGGGHDVCNLNPDWNWQPKLVLHGVALSASTFESQKR